ncbi:1-deoxy-D-xylulose-5-phosphate synthase [Streptomyces alboniger]
MTAVSLGVPEVPVRPIAERRTSRRIQVGPVATLDLHTVGVMDPLTCEPLTPSQGSSWTSVFGDELVRIGEERDDVVAITAAMLHPVGSASSRPASPTGCGTWASPSSTRPSPRRV